MSITTIANKINNKILMEFLSISEGSSSGFDTSLWIVCIDVDDWDFKSLGKVTGMEATARFSVRGSETELVVRDKVQTAAR